MKKTSYCPVCQRQEIEGSFCPNCETNLTVFRVLADLPSVKNTSFPLWLSLTATVLSLVMGLGIFWVFSTYYHNLSQASTVITVTPPPVSKSTSTPSCSAGFYYTVRSGDSLSAIAANFYGNLKQWGPIIEANPQLKARENLLRVGEVLLIPNSKEYSCENI